MKNLYIGLMSGTSMDGIDVALVDFSGNQPHLIDFDTFDYDSALLNTLHALCQPGDNEIVQLGQADRCVAMAFADAVDAMLEKNALKAQQIAAIGSHGQTVRHHASRKRGLSMSPMPERDLAFSLQIGDPNTLAVQTGIDVVADFRRKDIALGGQGAPLAPAFHKAVFSSPSETRAVVNIGGIANVTYLPSTGDKQVIGYDTGPGNTLMDAWCRKHTGQTFDEDGAWAAQGKSDPALLNALLQHPYIQKAAPKSTGREEFHLDWLQLLLDAQPHDIPPESVQATLVHFTCMSIAREIRQLGDVSKVYACGGGVRNEFLMECLETELFNCELTSTEELGIHGDAVEAVAFAWFAYAYKHNIKGNLPSVTGASRETILGGFYPAE